MMERIKLWLRHNLDLVAGVLLGVGAFVTVCGWRVLDFTNINFLMSSGASSGIARFDKSFVYLGSMIYRSEPFSWDIFRIHSLNPPDGIAGAITDVNPLWSLLFKLLGVFGFDPYWQTQGLLILASFVLSGVAATCIFRHIFRKREEWWLVPIASLFFIFSPVLLDRVSVHINLVMHWIFLFAFVLYLDNRLTRREWIAGAILLILSIGMHPYFLPMTMVPLGALALRQLSEKSISQKVFIRGTALWCAVVAMMALLLLPLGDIQSVQHGGYGVYSMNLNALFNPIWTQSNIIPGPLGQGEGNYEGDNYLGFGLLVLLVILIPAAIRAFIRNRPMTRHRWLLAGCGVLLFFALSYKIQLYNFTVFEYNPGFTRAIGETFRRSGSLFWPCWYFLSYSLIWFLFKTRKNEAKYILVALAALQLYDLYPTIRQTYESFERWSNVSYRSIFRSGAWNALFEKYGNVFIVGNLAYTYADQILYQDLWYMIPTRNIRVNDGFFVLRTQNMQKAKAEENLLKSGVIPARLPENTIFIFTSRALAESYLKHAPSLSGHVRELDGIHYLLWDKSLVEGNHLGSFTLNWPACDLNVTSTVVQVNRENCEVTSLANAPGAFTYVTYGPYIYLPQGNYSFAIDYTSTSLASAAEVGAWDVGVNYAAGDGATVLGRGALPSTDGKRETLRGTFTLPSNHTRDLFEIRTFARPDARLTIHGVEIKRID
jgi:hypothetical protein